MRLIIDTKPKVNIWYRSKETNSHFDILIKVIITSFIKALILKLAISQLHLDTILHAMEKCIGLSSVRVYVCVVMMQRKRGASVRGAADKDCDVNTQK